MTLSGAALELTEVLQRQIFAGAQAGAVNATITARPDGVVYTDDRAGGHEHRIPMERTDTYDFARWTSAIGLYPAPDTLTVRLDLQDDDYLLDRDLMSPRQHAVDVRDIPADDNWYRLHLVQDKAYMLPSFLLVRPDGSAVSSQTVPRGFPIHWSESREPGALVHTAFHSFIIDQALPEDDDERHDALLRKIAGQMLRDRMLDLMEGCDGDVWMGEQVAHFLPEQTDGCGPPDVVFYSTAGNLMPESHLPSDNLIGVDDTQGQSEYLLRALSPALAPERLLVRDLGSVLPALRMVSARATEADGTVTDLPVTGRRSNRVEIERTRIIKVRDITLEVERLERGDLNTTEGRHTLSPVERSEHQVDFYVCCNDRKTLLMVRDGADLDPEYIEPLLSGAASPEEFEPPDRSEWFWSYHVRRLTQDNVAAAASALRAAANALASAEVELDPDDGDLTIASDDGYIIITVRAG